MWKGRGYFEKTIALVAGREGKDALTEKARRGRGNVFAEVRIAWLVVLLALSWGCVGRINYQAGEIVAFERSDVGVELRFAATYGLQRSYYIFPREGRRQPPTPLVVAYSGVGSLALEWLDYIARAPNSKAGFLLIEYPGRGNSEGLFRLDLRESSSGALKALAEHLGSPLGKLEQDMVFLGHSFGTGAALQFTAESAPKTIVLVAPFDTFRKATFKKIGPLAWILPDKMDNVERVKGLCALKTPPKIIIFHGSEDTSLPVTMSRDLARQAPKCVEYHEIEGAGHSDVLYKAQGAIMAALFGP